MEVLGAASVRKWGDTWQDAAKYTKRVVLVWPLPLDSAECRVSVSFHSPPPSLLSSSPSIRSRHPLSLSISLCLPVSSSISIPHSVLFFLVDTISVRDFGTLAISVLSPLPLVLIQSATNSDLGISAGNLPGILIRHILYELLFFSGNLFLFQNSAAVLFD